MIVRGVADGSVSLDDSPRAIAEALYNLWIGASMMAKIHGSPGSLDRAMAVGDGQPRIDVPARRLTDIKRPRRDRDGILRVAMDAPFAVFDDRIETDAGADAGHGSDQRAAGRRGDTGSDSGGRG